MKRNKEYAQALEQARAATEDIKERGEAAIGDNALVFPDSLLTPEERAESDLRVSSRWIYTGFSSIITQIC